jgi:hypothetical protein
MTNGTLAVATGEGVTKKLLDVVGQAVGTELARLQPRRLRHRCSLTRNAPSELIDFASTVILGQKLTTQT